jgi:hypothetical protein
VTAPRIETRADQTHRYFMFKRLVAEAECAESGSVFRRALTVDRQAASKILGAAPQQ